MTRPGGHRHVVYQRRSFGEPVPLWGGGLVALIAAITILWVGYEPPEPAAQQVRVSDHVGRPDGGTDGHAPAMERAVAMPVRALSAVDEARLWARIADRPEDDEGASVKREAPPATEAQYLESYLRFAATHGDEALGVAVQTVLETDLPDCAKLAGLRACEQRLLPNCSDLLADALVAPAEPAIGRSSLAEWAASRLGSRAESEPHARELLSFLVEGRLVAGDLPMRRRAATSLARHGSDAEVSRLLAYAQASPDALLARSVKAGLAGRTDSWGSEAQAGLAETAERLARHSEP